MQERQRDKFAKETAALLRKMEVSVTGLDYAAQEMNKVCRLVYRFCEFNCLVRRLIIDTS